MTERYREREHPAPLGVSYKEYLNGSGTPSYENVGYNPATHQVSDWFSEEMTDHVTPSFRQRIAAGQIINNPVSYSAERGVVHGSPIVSHHDTVNGDVRVGYGHFMNANLAEANYLIWRDPNVLHVVDQNLRDRLIQEAKHKALKYIDSSEFAFAEDAAEVRETIRWMRSPLRSLREKALGFRKAWRRRQKIHKVRAIDAVSDTWLEQRFAVMPLVRSINDALEALRRPSTPRQPRLTARGVARSLQSDTGHHTHHFTYRSQPGYRTFDRRVERTVDVRATVFYELRNPLDDWRFRLGFRLKDVPETLWAVTPYSFMIDRMFNITGAIRGLTNMLDPNVLILAGCVSVRNTTEVNSWLSALHIPTWSSSWSSEYCIDSRHDFDRNPWTPVLADVIPPVEWLGLVRDATSILDLATLAWSGFRR